jgi:hypothetical protein
VTVNSKKENSSDFCLNFVQEFGLWVGEKWCLPNLSMLQSFAAYPPPIIPPGCLKLYRNQRRKTTFRIFLPRSTNDYSLVSGLLGSVTQTADVEACPGKCVHSLASLICDEVREEVECPGASMKCCVERGGGMPPLPANERVPSSSANEKTAPVNIMFLATQFCDKCPV